MNVLNPVVTNVLEFNGLYGDGLGSTRSSSRRFPYIIPRIFTL